MSFFLVISPQQGPSVLENSATVLMFISSLATLLLNTPAQNTVQQIYFPAQILKLSMQQYLII